MTEEEAKGWVADRFGAAAVDGLAQLAALVIDENGRQNLIAPSTIEQIWARHLVDSAQLVPLAVREGRWLDIGTGGGFPGLAVAMLTDRPMVLVEPRRRRAAFLEAAADALEIGQRITVEQRKVEAVETQAAIISARAVASVENLLRAAARCGTTGTQWLLPRGRIAPDELAALTRSWKAVFHVEPSITDPASSILALTGVTAR